METRVLTYMNKMAVAFWKPQIVVTRHSERYPIYYIDVFPNDI